MSNVIDNQKNEINKNDQLDMINSDLTEFPESNLTVNGNELKIIDSPHNVLKNVYGFDEFRDNQLDMINAGLNGRDVLGILTTGGGKSLCFQVPALCVEGTTLVISPIISLMKDQVDRLRSMGVSAGYVTSTMSAEDTSKELNAFSSNQYKLFYVSPERLQSPEFKDRLKGVNVSFLAIDEAHCVSVWGHDFRPSFKHIRPEVEELERFLGRRLTRLAYTATATDEVREDIKKQLAMNDPYAFVGRFDRSNIEINVRESTNKNGDVQELLSQLGDSPTIIYCATVKAVNSLYEDINKIGKRANKYNGQMKGPDKDKSQEEFLSGEVNVMIATNAFGMGIDKSDIRNIIHYHMPGNIENYFQEAGRAGRDGELSKAFLLYNEKDFNLQEFFIDNTFPSKELIEGVRFVLNSFSNDDALAIDLNRIMYAAPDSINKFQANSCLRILNDQGVIDIKILDNDYENMNIEVTDISKEIDYEYLAERRKNSMDKLQNMDAFCRTNLCRRRFVLRYFGEQQGHKNCGNCDRCISQQNDKDKENQIIPPETINNVISTIDSLDNKVSKKFLFDILLGVNSFASKRRKYDQLETFSCMKNWTKADIEKLYERLTDEQIIKTDISRDENVTLTKNGVRLLKGDLNLVIDASSNYNASENVTVVNSEDNDKYSSSTKTVFDSILFDKLIKIRKLIAHEAEKPAMMICSDKTLKLMSTMKPENRSELNYCGLRPGPARLFGDKFISNIQKHVSPEKKSDLDSELDSF
jgi:RecQ family ATP-dependent DNA helicase